MHNCCRTVRYLLPRISAGKVRKILLEDSLLLHDDLMRSSGFGAFLGAQLPNYAPFGITYVTQIQWQNLFLAAQQQGGAVAEIAGEIDSWAQEMFQSHTMFTILGM